MSNRDNFNRETREIVAARACWRCSFPDCTTGSLIGPSDESSEGVSRIGIVAHIAGAAPGPGSRRYDPSMSDETRRSASNAIFLCATHATMIDRDEVSFPVERLHAMKRVHEAKCLREFQAGSHQDVGAGLLAIGPDVICTGDLAEVDATRWTLRLRHFISGDLHKLVLYIDGFASAKPGDRYVLSNELGDGRSLNGAPSLAREASGLKLVCPVAAGAARCDAQRLGGDYALHPETGDLYLNENGGIARVSGVAYLPQKVSSLLSMQRNESPFHPDAGMRFFEFFEAYKGSPWLPQLMQLDVIRQASIQYVDAVLGRSYTPLQCVTRVRGVELLSDTPEDNRLPVRLDFDVQGVGRWQHETRVYIPTKEDMAKRAEMIAEMAPLLSSTR